MLGLKLGHITNSESIPQIEEGLYPVSAGNTQSPIPSKIWGKLKQGGGWNQILLKVSSLAKFMINFSNQNYSLSCPVPVRCQVWGLSEKRRDYNQVERYGALAEQIPHILHLPVVYRETLASQAFPKFQRVNLIREVRKCRKKEKEERQNNYSSAMQQSQGPLISLQGL